MSHYPLDEKGVAEWFVVVGKQGWHGMSQTFMRARLTPTLNCVLVRVEDHFPPLTYTYPCACIHWYSIESLNGVHNTLVSIHTG